MDVSTCPCFTRVALPFVFGAQTVQLKDKTEGKLDKQWGREEWGGQGGYRRKQYIFHVCDFILKGSCCCRLINVPFELLY